ncbi:oxygen-independent coproporphyrinogen III oxidase [Campylobacter pinnipediorum subsp. caledonicus]|uniref:Heme chaperone HemW n=1 Tax=Campylobacter pinnipediorum subsp. caledonicus TaxID=1874362 RepID=A0A1S6U8G6_9BACT|nr:radical SAM family heme chaperone HemW [Campylobacter pinnipediorum]AQW86322.1 oxygen-independent coproporphyrinogen III oxidase [Campylobacter pinnipediorum subsp. caledonicus]AQW87975.1 oxygen-independent coproporphyrinogen III oxidase [Campylobacter pinnipediorum subsp. caledonicus]OPA71421.1 coproporphyrinogen III oxidase [Campylobacter pinnipediorum subsp. caledonicus]
MLLYIHIPFCESKCPYCAFGSVVGKDSKANSYFKALVKDLKFQISNFKNLKIKTVFIGGGTPSVINANLYQEIFDIFLPYCSKNVEITSEANPNSASLEWLKKMKEIGVNRISFGVQSFNEKKLKLLGRTHNAQDAKNAVINAKNAGFKNINVDIIYSTKFDNKKLLKQEIESIKQLKINHLSAYSLTLEENTPFYKKTQYQNNSPILANFIISEIKKAGFNQYEISNFGKACQHNLNYWKGDEYIGIGAYSVGFYDKKRLYASENMNNYIKNPLERKIENLSKDDLLLEHIFLGARSKIGIDKKKLSQEQLKKAEILKKSRKIMEKNGRYFVRNFLLADEIALFINEN